MGNECRRDQAGIRDIPLRLLVTKVFLPDTPDKPKPRRALEQAMRKVHARALSLD
jgi:hypothetical protein